ncbi:hypothetical protein SBI_08337 [Streptomyces bingchenggensis BCW-1]|uniref:Uncharacterized protein n=1 Tax=Streptomyces bingchenggensis (strain BCW-1) TaxID=749414 RepID=D7BRA5_STRBB|nr:MULTISPECIES: hypothetical protein [Streptomyces]ADI11455.1 hypothetical protein SBI_08337 [Streptomyces bingchenggensis BCW-1]
MSSQQPASAPIPPDAAPAFPAAPATAPAPRKSPRALAAALIVGILIGGAGVGVAWAVSGDSSAGGAAGDARGACDALSGFEPSDYVAKGAKGEIALNRFGGAITLSAAAAAGDARYKPLAKALLIARNQHAATYDFGNSEVKKNLDKARQICDDLD